MSDQKCYLCDLLSKVDEPTFICEFPNSIAYLIYEQDLYPGSAILVLKEHYDHVHEMPHNLLHAFTNERSLFVNAVFKAFPDTNRMNYANLGNSTSHVHEHLIARHAGDKKSGRSPWPFEDQPHLADDEYRLIASKIRDVLDSARH